MSKNREQIDRVMTVKKYVKAREKSPIFGMLNTFANRSLPF